MKRMTPKAHRHVRTPLIENEIDGFFETPGRACHEPCAVPPEYHSARAADRRQRSSNAHFSVAAKRAQKPSSVSEKRSLFSTASRESGRAPSAKRPRESENAPF